MFDLIIRSDRVVTPAGVAACDVAIQGEKIAAVAVLSFVGSDGWNRGETAALAAAIPSEEGP